MHETGMLFPDPNQADADGLVAYGGDLSPPRLLTAYAQGIFPWPYDPDWPLLWFSPDPRVVLIPAALHISRSLRKTLNQRRFDVRFDTAFDQVVRACATIPRPGQERTWITDAMRRAYGVLHDLGFAHSVEAWSNGTLVGGLYGVSLGAAFFGESMFAQRPNASKVAFVHLVWQLQAWDFHFVDCQVHTDHLARFGAVAWPRQRFLRMLDQALHLTTRRGRWQVEDRAHAAREARRAQPAKVLMARTRPTPSRSQR
ncbi:Leucyl/phenylalanyl-tRNA--protein transferase [Candidatus Entotheonellaceae bacterium PAL068K]